FTHIPVNAPRCPMHHFQQDGHMAMHNPAGRANYEPNSWSEEGGPRENPEIGYRSAKKDTAEAPVRLRAESFADHYSQPRQFYISQTEVEQMHIANAFTFELSKCEREDIRARVVSHLRNIDGALAETVAGNLGLELPEAAEPAVAPRDLPASDPLSILKNGPDSFAGRVLGIYVADGSDQGLVEALQEAAEAEGAFVTVISEKVGGAKLSGGKALPGQETFAGGPSVLYDAVAFVFPEEDGARLGQMKPLSDALSDAWAHGKVIGYTAGAKPLFDGVGLADPSGPGAVALGTTDAQGFITECRALRHWDR
ncbi:catalase-related domain-containing protein, partial [Cribrihabitans sp. XS_ASV171]